MSAGSITSLVVNCGCVSGGDPILAGRSEGVCDDDTDTRSSSEPFIHLFGEDANRFVLDVHTSRLFSVTSRESAVLSRWKDGTPLASMASEYPEEVRSILRLREQRLFCGERPQALAFGADWQGICDKIQHERYLTILELTQECNLRCRYCACGAGRQGRRGRRPAVMNEDVLRAAVASAFAHGDALEEIALGFYGGEPLLAFESLKIAVRAARANASGQRVALSLTTNCTLMDVEKATFLRDAGFSILVSVDGPQHMHDRYRRFPDGHGSYRSTMRGLRTLLEVFDTEALERISLNMVVPFAAWLPHLEDFWESEPWVPRNLRAQASFMVAPPNLHVPCPPEEERPTLMSTWLSAVREGKAQRTSLGGGMFDVAMAKLHQRSIFASPRREFFPNGCCIPGNRKVFVAADGEYRICERAHGTPAIGSVHTGVDLPRIRALVEEYCEASRVECLKCWAVGLCPLCFANAYEGGRLRLSRKNSACEEVRNELERDLVLYGSLVEDHPWKAEEWERYELL